MNLDEFFNKIGKFLDGRGHPKTPFHAINFEKAKELSTQPHVIPTVTLMRSRLEEFRAHYAELAAFAAAVTQAPLETLCKADMMRYFVRRMREEMVIQAAKDLMVSNQTVPGIGVTTASEEKMKALGQALAHLGLSKPMYPTEVTMKYSADDAQEA